MAMAGKISLTLVLALGLLATLAAGQEIPGETATPVRPRFATLAPVFFAFDSIELSDSTRAALIQTAEILNANPEAVVNIVGHADERGSDSYNLRLGQRRAGVVAAFLAARGVAASRISTTSAGEHEPLRAGHDEDAWAHNRRVEFRVKGNTPLRLPRR